MRCPQCKSDTRVIDVRASVNGFRRRRECVGCGYRYTTREILDADIHFKENAKDEIMQAVNDNVKPEMFYRGFKIIDIVKNVLCSIE